MRQQTYFEAYLDDYDKINIFMSRSSYDGKSNQFFLRNEVGEIQELQIQSIEQTYSNYNKYRLLIPNAITIGSEYYVVHQFARDTPLRYSGITKTQQFDEAFFYEGNDLGVTYYKDQSHFAVWAPTAAHIKLEVCKHDVYNTYEMKRSDAGVFRHTILDDLENATYRYLVRVNGEWKDCIDPYGIASTSNSQRSVIVNQQKIKVVDYPLEDMESACDAIVYECSVRDLTMQKGIGVHNPGTFMGFCEENEDTQSKETGFSYLKKLGITHVQLMPVLDFGSVDENYPSLFYNWGYDPVQWRCLEGSLTSDANNPYTRIFGFIKLVETCHKNHMRVNLDVVFNHVYDMPKNAMQVLVPDYYFQMNEQGDYSNGTYCGNDIDSSRKMCRKLIIDSCMFLCKTYKIDGLRFDLMGILDVDTMNEVYTTCRKMNPNFMVYGEGWDMPSILAHERRAAIPNQAAMPRIAHFSDRFRDISKGNTSPSEVNAKGYCSGAIYLIENMKNVLIASCVDYGDSRMFNNPVNVVNYVECHDNMTCWDKLKACCIEEGREIRMKRQMMLIAAVLLSQGIPFIHSGQEFARTKYNKHNTYNDSDEINKIDYDRKNQQRELVEASKALIAIRKTYKCLRYASSEEIIKHVDLQDIDHKVIVYRIHDANENLVIFFNPTQENFTYHLESEYKMLFYNGKVENMVYQDVSIDKHSTIVMSQY